MATTTPEYRAWIAAGKPYTDCTPGADLKKTLQAEGFTVYSYPDDAHLLADPPEDHTPYSRTGWPRPSPRWYGHAIDIMPSGQSGPTLAQLGEQIFNDKLADVPGARLIKYMNWEPKGPGGPCYHDSWEPTHNRSSSTDKGHIHISFRSDATQSTEAKSYNPVARWKDAHMAAVDLTPAALAKISKIIWQTDGQVDQFPGGPGGTANEKLQGQTPVLIAATHAQPAHEQAEAAHAEAKAARADVAALSQQVAEMRAELLAAIASGGHAQYVMTGELKASA